MPEKTLSSISEAWGWIVVSFAIAGAWWRGEYRDKATREAHRELREEHYRHIKEHRALGYITKPEHDGLQAVCQGKILSELAHIRELIEGRLARVERDIDDLKRGAK